MHHFKNDKFTPNITISTPPLTPEPAALRRQRDNRDHQQRHQHPVHRRFLPRGRRFLRVLVAGVVREQPPDHGGE